MLLTVAFGTAAVELLEIFGKMIGVIKPHVFGNLADFQVRCQQEIGGLIEFEAHNVPAWGDMAVFLEQRRHIADINLAILCGLPGTAEG